MLGSLDVFAIAAICATRGLTPDETNDVQAALVRKVVDPELINAGEAQRFIESAIDEVLKRTRGITIFEEPAADEKPPSF